MSCSLHEPFGELSSAVREQADDERRFFLRPNGPQFQLRHARYGQALRNLLELLLGAAVLLLDRALPGTVPARPRACLHVLCLLIENLVSAIEEVEAGTPSREARDGVWASKMCHDYRAWAGVTGAPAGAHLVASVDRWRLLAGLPRWRRANGLRRRWAWERC